MDYERVRGWTKSSRLPAGKSSLFDLRKLFIPINQGNVHWVLVVVDMEDPDDGGKSGGGGSKVVSFFDSFGKDGTSYVEVRPGPTRATKQRQMLRSTVSYIMSHGKQTTAPTTTTTITLPITTPPPTTTTHADYTAPLSRVPKTSGVVFFCFLPDQNHGSTYAQANIMAPPRCRSPKRMTLSTYKPTRDSTPNMCTPKS